MGWRIGRWVGKIFSEPLVLGLWFKKEKLVVWLLFHRYGKNGAKAHSQERKKGWKEPHDSKFSWSGRWRLGQSRGKQSRGGVQLGGAFERKLWNLCLTQSVKGNQCEATIQLSIWSNWWTREQERNDFGSCSPTSTVYKEYIFIISSIWKSVSRVCGMMSEQMAVLMGVGDSVHRTQVIRWEPKLEEGFVRDFLWESQRNNNDNKYHIYIHIYITFFLHVTHCSDEYIVKEVRQILPLGNLKFRGNTFIPVQQILTEHLILGRLCHVLVVE